MCSFLRMLMRGEKNKRGDLEKEDEICVTVERVTMA